MTGNEQIDAAVAQLFYQARIQFGKAVKAYWMHDGDGCPGCGRDIDALRIKGQEAISLNAFIYRERGVLIAYFLCSRCAKQIFSAAKLVPGKQIARHDAIEATLVNDYKAYLRTLDG